jgi:hypothetical protein
MGSRDLAEVRESVPNNPIQSVINRFRYSGDGLLNRKLLFEVSRSYYVLLLA